MNLKCVIIDDEPLAREGIAGYIDQIDFLDLVGTGANPVALTRLLENHDVDLIFLDIQMPVMNGIDYLKMTNNPPMVIITTAYPNFALEGFKLDVLDYLLKPITFDRFFKASCKARDYQQLILRSKDANGSPAGDYFFVKCGYTYERIYVKDILYIQSMQNYVTIYTPVNKYTTLLSLKDVQENLDSEAFIRVHKSYIVAIAKIDAIENTDILVNGQTIPLSRRYREQVLEQVVTKRLWKRP